MNSQAVTPQKRKAGRQMFVSFAAEPCRTMADEAVRTGSGGGGAMRIPSGGPMFCLWALGLAVALAGAVFLLGFVVPVLARSLWVLLRGAGRK